MVALGQAKWPGLLGPLAVSKARGEWEMTILQSGCPMSLAQSQDSNPRLQARLSPTGLSVVLRQVSLGRLS